MTRFQPAIAFVLLLLVAGCANPPAPTFGPRLASSHPTDPVPTPAWHVGQNWNYGLSDGSSQMWVVAARETHNGRDSFRVDVTLSETDRFGATAYTRWIDPATLGLIEETGAQFTIRMEPPAVQYFPMTSREYNTSARFGPPPDPQERLENHWIYAVGDWYVVGVPVGEFVSRHVNITSTTAASKNASLAVDGWFSPEVGNLVEFRDSSRRRFTLESWTA